jgi:hypothetical protein
MLTYSNLYLYIGKYELYKFPELADQEQFKCRVQLVTNSGADFLYE